MLRLERELLDGTYKPGRYVTIKIRDPKPRTVSAAPFRDRVVHHSLYAVIEPIFELGFVFDSYANRAGKGTHRAVVRYELPNLLAFNFMLHNALGGGGTLSLRVDPQGKTLAQGLLTMQLDVPEDVLASVGA